MIRQIKYEQMAKDCVNRRNMIQKIGDMHEKFFTRTEKITK